MDFKAQLDMSKLISPSVLKNVDLSTKVPPEFDLGMDDFIYDDTLNPQDQKGICRARKMYQTLTTKKKANAMKVLSTFQCKNSVRCPIYLLSKTHKRITTGHAITSGRGFVVATTTFLRFDVPRTSWTKHPGM